jgi:hypothetical protein
MQRTQRSPRHDGRLSRPRGFHGLLTEYQRVGIDHRIAFLDPAQIALDDLDRRNVASAYARCEFCRGQKAKVDRISRTHRILSSSAFQLIQPLG